MKIYAKQLDAENFDYRIYEDNVNESIIVDGGRDFVSMNDDNLVAIKKMINDYNSYDYEVYYEGSIKMYVNDYLPKKDNLKRYSGVELHRIKELLEKDKDEETILTCLEIITGKTHKAGAIRGYCQGDYCKIYYPEDVSQEELDYLEAVYFGTGTEYEVHDEDNDVNEADDISGYTYLSTKWRTEDVKKEIASFYKNTKPEDVVLYTIKKSYKVTHYIYEVE